MSVSPAPLTNMANALMGQAAQRSPSVRDSLDPQSGLFLSQKAEEWKVFSYAVVRKRADEALQQAVIVQDASSALADAIDVTVQAENPGSIEMQWLVDNARALGKLRGEWLLISGRGLVLHSADFEDIRRAITDRAIESPFVYYVPTEPEANFLLD